MKERLQPDIKGRIIGFQTQMRQYNLLFGLKLCERVLKETDNLSKTLQLQSLSADESQCLEEMTCLTLRGMKTEQAFDLFFQRLELLLHQAGVVEPSLPRSRKLPKRLEYGDGEAFHSSTVEKHYRRKYFEVLDLEVCSITTHFDQHGYTIYKKT